MQISGSLLKEKTLELVSKVGLNDFKASNGWLQKFKERHQISYRNICGDAALVKQCIIIEWLSEIKDLIRGYDERNIFNRDETGLFFRVLPKDTLNFLNETCSEGNLSKERFTVMLCTNANGEFEKPLIIGKMKRNRYLKNTDELGIIWKSNINAWMTREIMTEWLLDFDCRMTQAKRKIILFLDNASSHTLLNNLQSVKLIFFPPYISSSCQPLGQGVVQNFKTIYRQQVLKHQLVTVDNNATGLVKRINVLDAILWIKSAINEVQRSTVRNCFIKSGISFENTIRKDNFKELLVPLADDDLVNYAEFDKNLLTENQSLDLIKIMKDITETQMNVEDDDSEEDTSSIISKDTPL